MLQKAQFKNLYQNKLFFIINIYSKDKNEIWFKVERPKWKNLIDAICRGASDSVPIVVGIAATMMSFVCLIEYTNHLIRDMGEMIGYSKYFLLFNSHAEGGLCEDHTS